MTHHKLQGGGAPSQRAARPPRVERVPVLLLLHWNAGEYPYVQVRADRARIDLAVVEGIALENPENGATAEEYDWLRVPRRHRHLWPAPCLLGEFPIIPRNAEEEAWRRWRVEAVCELRELRAELSRARKERVPA